MTRPTRIAVTGLLLAMLTVTILLGRGRDAPSDSIGDRSGDVAVTTTDARASTASKNSVDREAIDSHQAVETSPATGSARVEDTLAVAGLVLDVEGSPVVGVRVALHAFGSDEPDGRTESRSDTAGRFAFERPRSGGVVRVVDERWVTVLEPTLFDGDQVHGELTVVVAPNGPLAGVVVDEAGLPVAGATLWVVLGVDLRPRIGRVLDRCVDAKFTASTDAAGAFAMPRAPSTMTTRVLVTATGFAMANVAVEGDPLRLRIVLRREHAGDELKGRVLDATTRAPVRAHVTLGDLATATDAEGNFRLALWQAGDSANPELVALAAQRLPARVRPTGADWRVRGAWPGDLTLLVGGSGLRIRGRVEHADGTPVTDPRVSFAEPAPLVIPDGLDVGEDGEVWLSSVATGSGDGPPPGSFETPPVEPGRYRLRVLDPATLDELLSDPIDAGRDGVVLRMPALGLWPPLRGMVVDRRGNACAGADWLVERGARDGEAARHGDWHQADEQGRIDHAPLSRAIDTLCVKAAGMAEWVRVPLASLPRVDEFRVVVPIGCQARIELDARWRDADTAVLADGTGAASPVVITRGDMAWGTREIHLDDGKSQTFVALDDCVELRLLRGGEILHRIPIALQPGQLTVLRP